MAVIGVGLIGSSLAFAAKRRRLAGEIIGYDVNIGALRRAVRLGAIDRYTRTAAEAADGADLVVLATPVGSFESIVKDCASSLIPGSVLTDVGSVKGALIGRIEAVLPPQVSYLSSHPLAGRERSGIEAATPTLFEGSRCLLTPGQRYGQDTVARITRLWKRLGATVETLDPVEHDRNLAIVSHLPHVVAYALVNCALEASHEYRGLLNYSAGGFRDFTRIAASSPVMWRDICLENRDAILEALRRYAATFGRLRAMVESSDGPALEREFDRARRVKEQLRS